MTRLHRPYARKKGGPPSVTTILGAMDKPGLSWAAAKETAMFAVFHLDEWHDLDEAAAVDRLYRHHRGVWDHRAALGTLVHNVNEAWAHGETVDVEQMVADVVSECEECNDAPAIGEAWFNGRTLVKLCADCLEWWDNYGLIEAREVD